MPREKKESCHLNPMFIGTPCIIEDKGWGGLYSEKTLGFK